VDTAKKALPFSEVVKIIIPKFEATQDLRLRILEKQDPRRAKASAGTALAFTSDLSVRSVTSTNVYVTGVNFNAENVGTQNIRNFTLTLQEA
jgi:hypothetical protein